MTFISTLHSLFKNCKIVPHSILLLTPPPLSPSLNPTSLLLHGGAPGIDIQNGERQAELSTSRSECAGTGSVFSIAHEARHHPNVVAVEHVQGLVFSFAHEA